MGLWNSFTHRLGIDIQPKTPINIAKNKTIAVKEDGSTIIESIGPSIVAHNLLNMEFSFTDENDLIKKFRDMSLNVYCSRGIDNIITECISNNDDTGCSVQLNLDRTDFDEGVCKKINDEFDKILKLMDFNNKGESIFRSFYVDGRIYFQKVVDTNHPEKGLIDLIQLDSLDVKKIKQVTRKVDPDTGALIVEAEEDFYYYNPRDLVLAQQYAVLYTLESIASANSGQYLYKQLTNASKNGVGNYGPTLETTNKYVVSYLYPAIKPLNQLDWLEQAQIILRVSRSPERRVHYVDIAGLAPSKSDQAIKDYVKGLKNEISYNPSNGEVVTGGKVLSMQDDIVIPRRNGTNAAQIESLPGVTQIDRIADIEFFLKKLYKALRVPLSRLNDDQGSFLGRSTEISRDELNFSKFCNNLKGNFNQLFLDCLKTQLILKNIVSLRDWKANMNKIVFAYSSDTYISQLREIEMLSEKITSARDAQGFVGTYLSKNYINKKIFGFTDEQIEQMKEEIKNEKIEEGTSDNTATNVFSSPNTVPNPQVMPREAPKPITPSSAPKHEMV